MSALLAFLVPSRSTHIEVPTIDFAVSIDQAVAGTPTTFR
jgi:hypothetical protein